MKNFTRLSRIGILKLVRVKMLFLPQLFLYFRNFDVENKVGIISSIFIFFKKELTSFLRINFAVLQSFMGNISTSTNVFLVFLNRVFFQYLQQCSILCSRVCYIKCIPLRGFTLSILLTSLIGINAWGQTTAFSENFTNWSSNLPNNGNAWTFEAANWFKGAGVNSNAGKPTSSPNGDWCEFNTYWASSGTSEYIATPNINLASYTSATLTFKWINTSGTDVLRVRFFDGSAWQTISTFNTVSSWTSQSITIPSAYFLSNFSIRFVAVSDYGSTNIAIDEVIVSGTACSASYSGTYTVGTAVGSTWPTLTSALADLKNCQTGNVILELDETYRQTQEALETYPLNFNGLLTTSSISLTIRPKSTVTALITIGGSSATTMLDFNGTDYVTIDGRIGSTGATSLITIDNTSTTSGATAINFYSTATNNTLQYCTLKSTATGATSGVVTFGTGSNATNTITYCNIDGGAGATPAPANAARVGIYSTGTANDNMTITNNNVYNCFNTTVVSPHAGIYVGNGSSAWTITGNSIYQTSNRTVTGITEYYGIVISNTSSVGNIVSNNYVGGTSSSCGGTKFTFAGTYSNIFRGIYINCGTSSSTTVNGNTVANLSFSSSLAGNYFYGINVTGGNVNIGTTSGTGNTIGSRTVDASTAANASIQLIPTASTANNALGIYSIITSNHTINYNRVAGINVSNLTATYPATFYGIYPAGTTAVNPTVTYNSVGSSNNANSIVVGTGATTGVNTFYGIVNQGYTGVVTMQYDTIQGVKVYGTGASLVYPIYNTTGATNSSISFNTIQNVSNASSGSDANAKVFAIYNSAPAAMSISSNTINAITCSNGYFRGIQDTVAASGIHTISSNIIGSSSVSNDISISSTNYKPSMGINAASTGIYTISSNTIQNVSQSGAAEKNLYGIQIGSTGTYTVSENTIDKLYNNTTGSYRSHVSGVNMAGIPNAASVIQKNKITNFKNLNSNGGYIFGIIGQTATSLKAYNNFFECDNEGSSNNNTLSIWGIYGDYITSLVAYHNTIYISGATSVNSADGHSFCIRQSTTPTVKNNILINTRTDGGSSASQGITFGTFSNTTYDYNYYYVKDATLTSGGGTSSIYHRDGSNTLPTINSDGSITCANATTVGLGADLHSIISNDIIGTTRPYVTSTSGGTKGCFEVVRPSTAVLAGTATICNGSSANLAVTITGGASPYTVVYSGGTVSSYTSASSISVSPTTTTTYTLTSVTDANSCVATTPSGSAVVTVRTVFTSGTIASTGQTICSGGTPAVIGSTTASSGGNAAITYSWRSSSDSYVAAISGETSATYTPPAGLTSTTSYRRYANDGTCNTTPTVSSGTWTVTINSIPATPTISGTASFCTGGSTTLTSSATLGNQWYKGGVSISLATATTLSVTTAGTYTVISTVSSCASSTSAGTGVTVNSIPSTPTISGTVSFCSGGSTTLTSSATAGNQWYKDGVLISGATATNLSVTTAGTYTVISTVSSCASTTSAGTVVTVNSIPTTYYSKSTGSLDLLASWGSNTDGTGCSPADFSTAGVTYIIQNNLSPFTSAAWTVSGAGSIVKFGNSSAAVIFTAGANLIYSCDLEITGNTTLNMGTYNLTLSGDFIRSSSTSGFSQTAGSSSTVEFSGSSQEVNVTAANGTIATDSDITFNHVTISGSDVKIYYNKTNNRKYNINDFTVNSGKQVSFISQ